MDTYETQWLEKRLSFIEGNLTMIAHGVRGDSEHVQLSPETGKAFCLMQLAEVKEQIIALRREMSATFYDEFAGKDLTGFTACALREWQALADRCGFHRCQRSGWRTAEGCECRWPDGTPVIHEAWTENGAKVLNQPGQKEVRVPAGTETPALKGDLK